MDDWISALNRGRRGGNIVPRLLFLLCFVFGSCMAAAQEDEPYFSDPTLRCVAVQTLSLIATALPVLGFVMVCNVLYPLVVRDN